MNETKDEKFWNETWDEAVDRIKLDWGVKPTVSRYQPQMLLTVDALLLLQYMQSVAYVNGMAEATAQAIVNTNNRLHEDYGWWMSEQLQKQKEQQKPFVVAVGNGSGE